MQGRGNTCAVVTALPEGVMRDAGRVPELCWAERATQTIMVVYLKQRASAAAAADWLEGAELAPAGQSQAAAADDDALAAMLTRICRDHGLVPTSDGGGAHRGSADGSEAVTHRSIRAVTPPGAPTAMARSPATITNLQRADGLNLSRSNMKYPHGPNPLNPSRILARSLFQIPNP
jgi:hypothetical protein